MINVRVANWVPLQKMEKNVLNVIVVVMNLVLKEYAKNLANLDIIEKIRIVNVLNVIVQTMKNVAMRVFVMGIAKVDI